MSMSCRPEPIPKQMLHALWNTTSDDDDALVASMTSAGGHQSSRHWHLTSLLEAAEGIE